MGLAIAFWIMAILGIASAVSVVVIKDVFRAALALIMCFMAVAGIYVTLSADFLAVVQILIYVGAISVLIILAIMMTKEFKHGSIDNKMKMPAFIAAALFLAVLLFAMLGTDWQTTGTAAPDTTVNTLAGNLFGSGGFILPMEIAAMLLLSAIIGAITLVREK